MSGMNIHSSLAVLNPEQLKAVQHKGKSLLILAGAGSGKTRVITTKIAYLIRECGVDPRSILAVTFTKKAANEMLMRAQQIEENARFAQIRTFHSFGSWFLRVYCELAGLSAHFTVYDDDDSVTIATRAIEGLNRSEAAAVVHKISRAKDYCLNSDSPDLARIDADPAFALAYEKYQTRLRETGNVDFGDLIQLPVHILEQYPEVRTRIQQRFKVILVDEYQDSNVAQFHLLQMLAGPETYVCVVGDDDQSIYRFRGAEVKNILTFQEQFEGTDLIRLERNYRSVSPILRTADEVVRCNAGRLGKTLHAERGNGKRPALVFLATQDEESAFCAELIEQAHQKGCPYADWAVLYRTNAQSLGFETEFLHRKIPYQVVGSLKFYDREEIKDVLAYLSLVSNSRDEIAFERVVNKPARSLGAVTRSKILDHARKAYANSDMVYGITDACRSVLPSLAKKAQAGLKEFLSLMDDLLHNLPDLPSESDVLTTNLALNALENTETVADPGEENLARLIALVVERSGLENYHTAQDEIAGTQRVANMQELVNSALLYPKTREGLTRFLDHIELDRAATEDAGESEDAVTLITLHNTKGLEFPRVIITGIERGIFPREDKFADELEEERRLFYVGITRARDELYLTSCGLRRLYGKTSYMEPSPFLYEIDASGIDVLGKKNAAFSRRQEALKSQAAGNSPSGTFSAAEKKNDTLAAEWKVGQKVFHDEYGYGVISRSARSDGELVITIAFETGAQKRFMPEYQAKQLMKVSD